MEGRLDGGEGEQAGVYEGTGKGDCAPGRGSLMSKGAVRQGKVPRGGRVGKTAKAERGGPWRPAESLDLLLLGKSCHRSMSPIPRLLSRTLHSCCQHS